MKTVKIENRSKIDYAFIERTKQYMADEEWNFACVFLPEEVANARVPLGLPGGRLRV